MKICGRLVVIAKRSHPELNPKIGIVEALTPYKNDPSMFISYRDINKIGINPQSKYDTPNGIYTYPLKEIWEKMESNNIPFAGDRKHVYLVKAEPLELSAYSNWKRDLTKIERLAPKFFGKNNKEILAHVNNWPGILQHAVDNLFLGNIHAMLPQEHDRKVIYKKLVKAFITYVSREARNSGMQYGLFWFATKTLGLLMNYNSPAQGWNTVLRMLGYSGFSDRTGKGIIHPQEPTQAVFLTKSAFRVIGVFDNIRPIEKVQMVDTWDEFLNTLNPGKLARRATPAAGYSKIMNTARDFDLPSGKIWRTKFVRAPGNAIQVVDYGKIFRSMDSKEWKELTKLIERNEKVVRVNIFLRVPHVGFPPTVEDAPTFNRFLIDNEWVLLRPLKFTMADLERFRGTGTYKPKTMRQIFKEAGFSEIFKLL